MSNRLGIANGGSKRCREARDPLVAGQVRGFVDRLRRDSARLEIRLGPDDEKTQGVDGGCKVERSPDILDPGCRRNPARAGDRRGSGHRAFFLVSYG